MESLLEFPTECGSLAILNDWHGISITALLEIPCA